MLTANSEWANLNFSLKQKVVHSSPFIYRTQVFTSITILKIRGGGGYLGFFETQINKSQIKLKLSQFVGVGSVTTFLQLFPSLPFPNLSPNAEENRRSHSSVSFQSPGASLPRIHPHLFLPLLPFSQLDLLTCSSLHLYCLFFFAWDSLASLLPQPHPFCFCLYLLNANSTLKVIKESCISPV